MPVMAIATLSPTDAGPLLPAQQQELLTASRRAKKIYRAANIAAFNAWSVVMVAALSLPLAIFDPPSLVVTIALGVVGYNEFRGRDRLRRFDPGAAHLLGWNQVALLALLIGYSLWCIGVALLGANPYEAELRAIPELQSSALGSIGQLYIAITVAVYGGVILGTLVIQGLNAWYYFSRRKHVQEYLAATPAWIIELQRTALTA